MRFWIVALVALALLAGCSASPRIDIAGDYLAARDRGDDQAARALLADEARIWFEKREGEGRPLRLGEGPWATWDRIFRSRSSRIAPFTGDDDSVRTVMRETNDYYVLLGRRHARYTLTLYFDDDNRIAGLLISPPPPAAPQDEAAESYQHREEFEAWARENEPDEWAYLRPDGRIDPSGDRAERTLALLLRWHDATGRRVPGSIGR